MKKVKYPIRENYYEEIKNKKLEEFYIIIQILTIDIALGEKEVLEKSKVYILYGINLIRKENNNRIIYRKQRQQQILVRSDGNVNVKIRMYKKCKRN